MTASIYHFFKFLVENSDAVKSSSNLEKLNFDKEGFVSSKSAGVFPDLAIKINVDDDVFTGGELIEFKGSQSMNISSFNSTIPTGIKKISEIIESPSIKTQMERAGNHIESLPYRDVYYLISGNKDGKNKVVLVHGNFFETIPVNRLIQEAFLKIMKDANPNMDYNELEKLSDLHIKQSMFSQVRCIDEASVKIRFRIMTEAESNANILNSNIYPQIKDDTLNLCIPYSTIEEKMSIIKKFKFVFDDGFQIMDLTHKGCSNKFVLFQIGF